MYQPINISEKINGRQKTTLVCLYSMHSVTKCRLSGYRKTCTSDDMNLAQAISCKVQAVCLTLTDDNRQIHMALVCKQQTTHQLYKKTITKSSFLPPFHALHPSSELIIQLQTADPSLPRPSNPTTQSCFSPTQFLLAQLSYISSKAEWCLSTTGSSVPVSSPLNLF